MIIDVLVNLWWPVVLTKTKKELGSGSFLMWEPALRINIFEFKHKQVVICQCNVRHSPLMHLLPREEMSNLLAKWEIEVSGYLVPLTRTVFISILETMVPSHKLLVFPSFPSKKVNYSLLRNYLLTVFVPQFFYASYYKWNFNFCTHHNYSTLWLSAPLFQESLVLLCLY